MSVLADMVRNIVALMLIAALLELILPEGVTVKFVRWAIGLMMAASIISSLSGMDLDWNSLSLPEDNGQAAQYIAEGTELASGLESEAVEQYQLELARQMESMAQLAEGVQAAQASVQLDESGLLLSAKIHISAEDDAAAERVQQLLSGFYLLDSSVIEVVAEVNTDV